jgi:hypothetical protein
MSLCCSASPLPAVENQPKKKKKKSGRSSAWASSSSTAIGRHTGEGRPLSAASRTQFSTARSWAVDSQFFLDHDRVADASLRTSVRSSSCITRKGNSGHFQPFFSMRSANSLQPREFSIPATPRSDSRTQWQSIPNYFSIPTASFGVIFFLFSTANAIIMKQSFGSLLPKRRASRVPGDFEQSCKFFPRTSVYSVLGNIVDELASWALPVCSVKCNAFDASPISNEWRYPPNSHQHHAHHFRGLDQPVYFL